MCVLLEPEGRPQHTSLIPPLSSLSVVSLDNCLGGGLAGKHLLEWGFRRVGQVAGIRTAGQEHEVLTGVGLKVFAHAGGDFTEASGQSVCLELLARGIPGTLLVTNICMTAGVYTALRGRGLRVPDDVSVLGFDGAPLSMYLEPALSTLRRPPARWAASLPNCCSRCVRASVHRPG